MPVAPQVLLILKSCSSWGKKAGGRGSKHNIKKDRDEFVSKLCFKMKVGALVGVAQFGSLVRFPVWSTGLGPQ